ncbi:MAG: hypothetical protein H0T99_09620 [Geodermatophilaceae bacterium]|nr:hypothetical protein [Geodermatophilaceae bacterium]
MNRDQQTEHGPAPDDECMTPDGMGACDYCGTVLPYYSAYAQDGELVRCYPVEPDLHGPTCPFSEP